MKETDWQNDHDRWTDAMDEASITKRIAYKKRANKAYFLSDVSATRTVFHKHAVCYSSTIINILFIKYSSTSDSKQ